MYVPAMFLFVYYISCMYIVHLHVFQNAPGDAFMTSLIVNTIIFMFWDGLQIADSSCFGFPQG